MELIKKVHLEQFFFFFSGWFYVTDIYYRYYLLLCFFFCFLERNSLSWVQSPALGITGWSKRAQT